MTLTQTQKNNDEEDSLHDLVFLRAFTTRSGKTSTLLVTYIHTSFICLRRSK